MNVIKFLNPIGQEVILSTSVAQTVAPVVYIKALILILYRFYSNGSSKGTCKVDVYIIEQRKKMCYGKVFKKRLFKF